SAGSAPGEAVLGSHDCSSAQTGGLMPSKLKQRRLRRLKADVAWWREEAEDCRSRLLELAGEIDIVRAQIVRVPMPVVVPSALIAELAMEKAVERLND
ncbi:hypothetical protein WMQ20_32040, partial [Escherichia coli]